MLDDDLNELETQLEAAPLKRSLHAFVRAFWDEVEPGVPFVDSWAIGAVCEFLQAWAHREFHRGVLNVPPSCGKSLLSEVFAPAWVWAQDFERGRLLGPQHRWLGVSFDINLVMRDSRKFRQIVDSAKFRNLFQARIRDDSRAASELWSTHGGLRFATSIAGKGTGWHYHSVVIDDPVKPQNVLENLDPADLRKVLTWHDGVLPTRRADPSQFGTMLVMQRILEGDLAGECLKREGYEHLCLPMHYSPAARWIRGGWSAKLDRRTTEGELLMPERFPASVVAEITRDLGDEASAQLEQNPIPRTGGLMREDWLRWEWVDIPYRGFWLQAWDLSAKGTDVLKHSAVHGALWCAHRTTNVRELLDTIDDRERAGRAESRPCQVPDAVRFHLVDEVWGVWPFEETLAQMAGAQLRPHWRRAGLKLVEEKAAGIQAIQVLTKGWRTPQGELLRVPGIVPTHPEADKLQRFRPLVPPAAQAGLVLLPPWRRTIDGSGPDAWRAEVLAFPRGKRNDRCDTTSEALGRFAEGDAGRWAAVRKLAGEG